MFWGWGLGSDLSSATCATRPSGTSLRVVLAASRRRLHLPGVPLSGEAAAPRAQELCTHSPTGNSTSTADLPGPRLLCLPHERDEQGTETGSRGAVSGVGEGRWVFFLNPQMCERVCQCGHTWAPGRTGLPLLRQLELAFSLTYTHIPLCVL